MTLVKGAREARSRAKARPARLCQSRGKSPTTIHDIEEQHLWPVVLLHNHDSSWTAEETREVEQCVLTLADALTHHGHPVEVVPTRQDVAGPMRRFDPRERIVLNWCEGIAALASRMARSCRILTNCMNEWIRLPKPTITARWRAASSTSPRAGGRWPCDDGHTAVTLAVRLRSRRSLAQVACEG